MKLELRNYKNKFENFYYITYIDTSNWECNTDCAISYLLGLEVKKYKKILKKFGAYNKNTIAHCFHKKGDGEMAIIELEKYLVMKKLENDDDC